MQKIVGSSPARGSSSFSLEKKELSSGVVACICLVSITDYSCTCTPVHWVTVQHLGLRAVRGLGSCGSRCIHDVEEWHCVYRLICCFSFHLLFLLPPIHPPSLPPSLSLAGSRQQLVTSLYRCTALLLYTPHSSPPTPHSSLSTIHRSLLYAVTQLPMRAFSQVAIATASQCWQWLLTAQPSLEFPVSGWE